MAITYTSSQNNRSSDANRKLLLGVNSSLAEEVSRATARETYIRENAAEAISSSIDASLSPTSTNPVQNKVITQELNKKESATRSLETVAYSGKYTDLTDRPTIPVNPTIDNALSGTSDNIVSNKPVHEAILIKANESVLKPVATSGDFNDLTNKPDFTNLQRPYIILYNQPKTFNVNGSFTWKPSAGYTFPFTLNSTLNITNWFTNNAISISGKVTYSFSGFDKTSSGNTTTFTSVGYNSDTGMPAGIRAHAGLVRYIYKGTSSTTYYDATCEFRIGAGRSQGGTAMVGVYAYMYIKISDNSGIPVINPYVLKATYIAGKDIDTKSYPAISQQTDMFPMQDSLTSVCSHGTAMSIGSRGLSMQNIIQKENSAEAKISSINSTIGDLT